MLSFLLRLTLFFATCFSSSCSYVKESTLELLYDINITITTKCHIDIIFVNGLDGSIDSWENEQFGTTLYGLLAKDKKLESISKRIWIYQYPTSLFQPSASNKAMSSENRAKNLLLWIYNSEITEDTDNPILFIVHSKGGLIVKELVNIAAKGSFSMANHQKEYYKIYKRIQGIIFYGTPHFGTELANIFKLITGNNGNNGKYNPLNLMATLLGISPSADINDLTSYNQKLMQIHKDFIHFIDHSGMQIISFFETLPEEGAAKLGIDTLVVPEYKATLLIAHEQTIPVDYSHTQLPKPHSYADLRYIPIRKCIRTLLKGQIIGTATVDSGGKVKVKKVSCSKSINDRAIKCYADITFHNLKWRYNGKATDIVTGIKVKSKGWKSRDGACEHAILELEADLKQKGYICG